MQNNKHTAVEAVASFLKERDENVLPGEADDEERKASAQCIVRVVAKFSSPTNLENAERAEMEPKVKPLEWLIEDDGTHRAKSAIGLYVVWPGKGFSYDLSGPVGGLLSTHKRIDAAKAAAQQDYEARIRSCLLDKPEAGEAEHDVVEEGAKILAKWLRYAWDGLQDRDISAEYPDWTHNSFGGYQLQGGKPALRKVASAILALSSPLSAGDTGEDHARGCEGRSYTCTCGYDDARDAEIDRLRRELEEARRALEQVCKDAKRVDVYQNGAPLDLVQPYLIDAARAALRAGEEGK